MTNATLRAACFALILLACCSCSKGATGSQRNQSAAQGANRPTLNGASADAWLTTRGDLADSGYCAASLKLPLETEPSWVMEYTPAEFSGSLPNALVHYDGTVFLTARNSLIMGVDAETGEIKFNRDLYKHYDRDMLSEEFYYLFLSPNGYLVSRDNAGRHYCWDTLSGAPEELWVGGPTRLSSGFVVNSSSVISGSRDEIANLDLLTGETNWSIPNLAGWGGIVLSRDGTAVTWSRFTRKANVVDALTGQIRWEYVGPEIICRSVIDDHRNRFYLLYETGVVECRELADGSLSWSFNWRDTLEQAEIEQLDSLDNRQDYYRLVGETCVMPDGLAVALVGGQVFRLDANGELMWTFRSGATVRDMLAFENAVLVSEFFTEASTAPWSRLYADMCDEPPGWAEHAEVDYTVFHDAELREDYEGPPIQVSFSRMTALDTATGEVLDYFAPELFPFSEMIPARDKIIYAEISPAFVYFNEERERRQRKVKAFSWLEQGDG